MTLRVWPRQPQSLAVVRQFIVAISASLPFAAIGSAIAWPSPTLPKIKANDAPVSLSVPEMSWMVSLLYLGSMASPIPTGYLADKFGRRKILLYSGLLSITSWLLILVATEAIHLNIARFLAGLQVGAVTTVQSIYIGEIAQPDIRGYLTTLNNFMLCAGSLLMFVVGPFVYYYDLALISLVLPLLFNLTFTVMPESPYYYMMKDKTEEARESLFWLRGDINHIELDMELNKIESYVKSQMKNESSLKAIFLTKASRKTMIISIVFSAFRRLSGADVIRAFATLTLPGKTFGVLDSSECVILLGIVSVVSSLLVVFITDKFERRVLVIVSSLGCGLSMLGATIWFFLDEKTDFNMSESNYIPLVGYVVHAVFFNLTYGNFIGFVKSELFPTKLKTATSVISSITLGLTGFTLNNTYLTIALWEGFYVNYLIFAVSCFLTVLFTVYYVPETKGKSLQEVQDVLGGVKRCRISSPVLHRTSS